jgi:hypothetical protein
MEFAASQYSKGRKTLPLALLPASMSWTRQFGATQQAML